MPRFFRRGIAFAVLWIILVPAAARSQTAGDWPMYNHDVVGSRHNPHETVLNRETVGQLVEKWRFPPAGSERRIGVIHATPIAAGGHVYFGTATDSAYYKLAPDGELCWEYRNPVYRSESGRAGAAEDRFR